VIIQRLYAVQGQNTSVKDDFSQGRKIKGMDGPSKNVQGCLVQGHLVVASVSLTDNPIMPATLGIFSFHTNELPGRSHLHTQFLPDL